MLVDMINFTKLNFFTALITMVFVVSGCVPNGIAKTEKFKYPDIKNEFCGVAISYQYCKCAFHNQFCKEIGMSKSAANSYVQGEFRKWWEPKLQAFGAACESAGGIFKNDECQYCKEDFEAKDGQCEKIIDEETAESDSQEVDLDLAQDVLNDDCTLNQEIYDRDWKKYSDIDNAIAFEDRSYETKQALTAEDNMIDKMLIGFALERDLELDRQMRAELVTYKDALVKNIKTNLLKSFWRLSWITYSTIKGAKGTGESYGSLLEGFDEVEKIATGLKVIQANIPGDSSLAIDTSTMTGKAKSIGANAALEAFESLGDPVKIATKVFEDLANAALPSADITPEEAKILEQQHLKKGVIDNLIKEIDQRTGQKTAQIDQIETEIAQLQTEVTGWEGKEKERVAFNLEDSCKKIK